MGRMMTNFQPTYVIRSILLTMVLLSSVLSAMSFAAIEAYQFETEAQQAQFYQVLPLLRCPKCQNQSISDSDAPIAKDIKFRVKRLIEEGASNDEIIEYMVARYGDFVSYRPPLTIGTALLWGGPPLLLIVILVGLWLRPHPPSLSVKANDQVAAEPVSTFSSHPSPSKKQCALLWCCMISCAVLLYGVSERFEWVRDWHQGQAKIAPELNQAITTPNDLLTLLSERNNDDLVSMVMGYQQALQRGLGSADAWSVLARVYARLNRMEEAHQASRKAYIEAPDNVQFALAVIQTDLDRSKGKLSQYSERLLQRLQGQYRDDPKVLSFVGIAYHAAGRLQPAREIFESIIILFKQQNTVQTHPEIVRLVQSMLSKIDMTQAMHAVKSTQDDAQDAAIIHVTVKITPSLEKQLTGQETLFVFAKAVQGPKFPLAVIKQSVGEITTWPVQFSLSDENRMMDGMSLQAFSPISISARISKTGQAIAQPGDLQAIPVEIKAANGVDVSLLLSEQKKS